MIAFHIPPNMRSPERSEGRIAHICAPAQPKGRGASLRSRLLTALGRARELQVDYWVAYAEGGGRFAIHKISAREMDEINGS